MRFELFDFYFMVSLSGNFLIGDDPYMVAAASMTNGEILEKLDG